MEMHKLPGEPIFIYTNTGHVADFDVSASCEVLARAFDEHQIEWCYIIADDRQLEASINDLDLVTRVLMEMQTLKGPGSPADPRIRGAALVAGNAIYQLFATFMNAEEGHNLPMKVFEDMDEALAYVRGQIRSETTVLQE
jgi:hypothetical protein